MGRFWHNGFNPPIYATTLAVIAQPLSIQWVRWLPLMAVAGFIPLIILLWPQPDDHAVAWIDTLLLVLVAGALTIYAVRLAMAYPARKAGSRLRAKLVIALVTMLLIPAGVIQIAANQMVGMAIGSWFDVRISSLMDRALQLGQGFYSRVDSDLQQGLRSAMNDRQLLELAAGLPFTFADFNVRLMYLLQQHGWSSLQIYDLDERMITEVRAHGLSTLASHALDDQAKITLHLGNISTKLSHGYDGEALIGYAPLRVHRAIIGLIRVAVQLPSSVVNNARAIESDYKKYRTLERQREKIGRTFAHAMLLVTLLLTLVAAWVATLFARRLTRPVEELAEGFQLVASGNLDVELRSKPDDELGSLSESFNAMASILRNNIDALESARQRADAALSSSRQRQQILEMLLENLQAAVFIVDRRGSIRLKNVAATAMFSMDEGSDNIASIAPLASFFDELIALQGGALQRTLDDSALKGRELLARGVGLTPVNSATTEGSRYLLVIDDVSLLAEAQRHQAWSEVARRLAHEIKNPLTPIKLAAERLQRRFRDQVDNREIFAECTHTVITQVERLQRLITDFSTMARMPRPRFAPCDIAQLLQEMAQLYRPYGQLEVLESCEVGVCLCDVDQVKQVLINLIDNALAASYKDRMVRLFVSKGEDGVLFHICNEGDGVPEELVDKLFEPYFSSKESGSGLGLSIAQRIAEDHGGRLFVASLVNPTEFCLQLPYEQNGVKDG
ncbi:MAG: ATP-binding protein [Mariprofundales bacterium]|nr:ATP-binding protein [Mariprofundales bacterium]